MSCLNTSENDNSFVNFQEKVNNVRNQETKIKNKCKIKYRENYININPKSVVLLSVIHLSNL